ncbi:MAG: methyl-accepting chemotaxis protein [Acidobacteriota bacterium]
MERIQTVNSVLGGLSRSTETQFLTIGERLSATSTLASELSNLTKMVGELLSGERLLQMNARLLELSRQVRNIDERSRSRMKSLQLAGDLLETFHRDLREFGRIVRALRIIGITIRIESARLSGQGESFSSVALEIKDLTSEIEARVETILAHFDAARNAIGETARRMGELSSSSKVQVQVLVSSTLEGAHALTAKQSQASKIARGLSDRFQQVVEHIGEVVVSLQSHDITRQRLEHVQRALDEVAGQLAGGRSAPEADEPDLTRVRGICSLQECQVREAGRELQIAADLIADRLSRVNTSLRSIAGQVHELTGTKSETSVTCLGELGRTLGTILSALSRYIPAIEELSKALGVTADAIDDVSDLVDEIHVIAFKTTVSALNTSVKAAHLGNQGAAVGVLAEELQELSSRTRSQVHCASEYLEKIGELGDDLSSEESLGSLQEIQKVGEELDELTTDLTSMEEEIGASLASAEEMFRRVSNEVEDTLMGMDTGRAVSTAVTEVIQILENLDRPSQDVPEPISGNELQDLETHYTMDQERKLHLSFLRSSDGNSPESTPILGGPEDDHFENNVELF